MIYNFILEALVSLSFLLIIIHVEFSHSDPLITVCDSSQYKRVVEDTCSSVYKRMKHPHHHFESIRHHDDHIEKHRHRHYHSNHRRIKHHQTSTTTQSSVEQHTFNTFQLHASLSFRVSRDLTPLRSTSYRSKDKKKSEFFQSLIHLSFNLSSRTSFSHHRRLVLFP